MDFDYKKSGESIYFRCRKEAAKHNPAVSSREKAAELLGISVSTLANYELGITKFVPVDIIVLMADLYNAPELKHTYCAHECPIGRGQPIAVEITSIETIALRLLKTMNDDSIAKKLQGVIDGSIKRLMIWMPPRHGKSMEVTETFPSFYLGHFPDNHVIEVSYGDELARRFGETNRSKIMEFGEWVFGIRISPTQGAKTNWEIDKHTGGMISVGVGGSITGKGADLLICLHWKAERRHCRCLSGPALELPLLALRQRHERQCKQERLHRLRDLRRRPEGRSVLQGGRDGRVRQPDRSPL